MATATLFYTRRRLPLTVSGCGCAACDNPFARRFWFNSCLLVEETAWQPCATVGRALRRSRRGLNRKRWSASPSEVLPAGHLAHFCEPLVLAGPRRISALPQSCMCYHPLCAPAVLRSLKLHPRLVKITKLSLELLAVERFCFEAREV